MRRHPAILVLALLPGGIFSGCGEGDKDCEPHASVRCTNDATHWVDSCGKLEEVKEQCQHGCLADGSGCKECDPHASVLCQDDRVYWVDSCGNLEEIKEQCQYGCLADNTGCEEGECTTSEDCGPDEYCDLIVRECKPKEVDACEQAAEVMEDAMGEFCGDKGDVCWFCNCLKQGMTASFDPGTHEWRCVDVQPCDDNPLTPEDECACEGDVLEAAQACLTNPDKCDSESQARARDACDASPIG
jgi:hypothetical protein